MGNSVSAEIYERTGLHSPEVTYELIDSPYSIVLDVAENRMHTIEAVMVATWRA